MKDLVSRIENKIVFKLETVFHVFVIATRFPYDLRIRSLAIAGKELDPSFRNGGRSYC